MSDYVLVTHWTGGDVYPFIRLGKMLRKEGHQVTILTHCVYEEKARAAGLDFVALDTLDEYQNMNRDLAMLADPIGHKENYLLFHKRYHGKDRLLHEVKLIDKVCTSDSIIVARFRSSISGMLVAEKNHLRYASMILAPNYFSHMELHNQLFGKAFCDEINPAREALHLPLITNWKDWLYSPKTILCGWPEWYAERDETWADGATPIGFLSDNEKEDEVKISQEIEDFIDQAHKANRKIAIVTGGSSRMVSKDFYRTGIHSCEKDGVYTIAVTPYDEYVPDEVSDIVKCVRYAPLRVLMKKVDLVVHHGGMGTINEAIDAAASQVILPHLTDGPDNADRLAALGIATKFPPKLWNSEEISKSIKKQLEDRNRELCLRYREMNQHTYDEKLWKEALLNLEAYTLPEQKVNPVAEPGQKEKAAGDPENALPKKHLSREMLMKLMKKKQESKSEQ